MLESLPDHLARQAVTHASWVEQRSDAYERLAFLGDSVLSLAVTTHLFPRLETYGAGRLTKIRAQTVSGTSCRAVAERLGVPERLQAHALRRGGGQQVGHPQALGHGAARRPRHRLGADLRQPPGAVALGLEARVEVRGDRQAQDRVAQEGQAGIGVRAPFGPGGMGEDLLAQVVWKLSEQCAETVQG